MFFVYFFLAKLVQSYKYNMHWHSLVFYQPQLYILPCLTKATKAKCTGTKTKSMHFFVYMFFLVKLMLVLIEQNALAQSFLVGGLFKTYRTFDQTSFHVRAIGGYIQTGSLLHNKPIGTPVFKYRILLIEKFVHDAVPLRLVD